MSKVKGFFIANIFRQELPSGTINGVNTAFTLSAIPHSDSAVMIFLNGLLQVQGSDYTISTTSINFTTAPIVGQEVSAFYISKR